MEKRKSHKVNKHDDNKEKPEENPTLKSSETEESTDEAEPKASTENVAAQKSTENVEAKRSTEEVDAKESAENAEARQSSEQAEVEVDIRYLCKPVISQDYEYELCEQNSSASERSSNPKNEDEELEWETLSSSWSSGSSPSSKTAAKNQKAKLTDSDKKNPGRGQRARVRPGPKFNLDDPTAVPKICKFLNDMNKTFGEVNQGMERIRKSFPAIQSELRGKKTLGEEEWASLIKKLEVMEALLKEKSE